MALSRPTTGVVGSPVAPVTAAELAAFAAVRPGGAAPNLATDVQPWLDAAIGHVVKACGPVAATDLRVSSWSDGRRGTLILNVGEIATVTELVAPDGTDVVGALTAADVDYAAAIIRLPRLAEGSWTVRVTTASSPERTAALKDAILVIGGHLIGAKVGVGASAGAQAYAIPNRATDLMAPWRIPAVA